MSAAVATVIRRRRYIFLSARLALVFTKIRLEHEAKPERLRPKTQRVCRASTIILHSGGPLNEWRTEEIDPSAGVAAILRTRSHAAVPS